MDKAEIEKIVFSNGVEERFGSENNETIINNNSTNRNKDPDKIYTTDGKVIYCEVVELKRFGVNYIAVNSPNNYVDYLANTKIDRIEYANGDIDYISGSPNNTKKRKDPKDFSFLSPHFISLNVGPAIPFGYIGSVGSGNTNNMITGVDVNLDFTYYLYRGMGFGLTAGYMHNPYNGGPRGFIADSSMSNIGVTVDGWHNMYVMAGLGYYNEYKRFLVDYKG